MSTEGNNVRELQLFGRQIRLRAQELLEDERPFIIVIDDDEDSLNVNSNPRDMQHQQEETVPLATQGEFQTPNPEQPRLLNVTPNAPHSEPIYYQFLEMRPNHRSSFPVAPAAAQDTMTILGRGNGNYLPTSNLAEQQHSSVQQPIVLIPHSQNSLGAETWTPAPSFPNTQRTLMQHLYPRFSGGMRFYPCGSPSYYYVTNDYLVYDPRYRELGLPIDPYLRTFMLWIYELYAAIASAQDLLDRLQ